MQNSNLTAIQFKELVNQLQNDFLELSDHYDEICSLYRHKHLDIENINPIYFTSELIIIAINNDDFFKIPYDYLNSYHILHGLNLSSYQEISSWFKKLPIDIELEKDLIEMFNFAMNHTEKDFSTHYYDDYVKFIMSKWNNGYTLDSDYWINQWPLNIVYNKNCSYLLLHTVEKYLKEVWLIQNSYLGKMHCLRILSLMKKHPNYSTAKMILKNIEAI